MKMKNTTTVFLFFCLSIAAFFVPGDGLSAQTPSYARRLLDATISTLESMDDYRAEFTLAYADVPAEKGVMYAKGEKYRVETDAFIMLCDGRYTYVIQDDEQEVTVRDLSDPEAGTLGGSVQQILRRFADAFVPRTDRREGTVQYLRLEPREQNNPSQYVTVGIDTENGLPVSLEDVSREGSHALLTIVSLERGAGALPSLYDFDAEKYSKKGYYIARP